MFQYFVGEFKTISWGVIGFEHYWLDFCCSVLVYPGETASVAEMRPHKDQGGIGPSGLRASLTLSYVQNIEVIYTEYV